MSIYVYCPAGSRCSRSTCVGHVCQCQPFNAKGRAKLQVSQIDQFSEDLRNTINNDPSYDRSMQAEGEEALRSILTDQKVHGSPLVHRIVPSSQITSFYLGNLFESEVYPLGPQSRAKLATGQTSKPSMCYLVAEAVLFYRFIAVTMSLRMKNSKKVLRSSKNSISALISRPTLTSSKIRRPSCLASLTQRCFYGLNPTPH